MDENKWRGQRGQMIGTRPETERDVAAPISSNLTLSSSRQYSVIEQHIKTSATAVCHSLVI